MEDWKTVFEWKPQSPHPQLTSNPSFDAYVTSLDTHTNFALATCAYTGDQICVHIPWCDRPECFQAIVSEARCVVRVYVVVRGSLIREYRCAVFSSALDEWMRSHGCFPMHVAAVRMLLSQQKRSQLCASGGARHCGEGEAEEETQQCDGARKLLPNQTESLRWMKSVERRVMEGDNHLTYEMSLPLPGSEWKLDMQEGWLVRAGAKVQTRSLTFVGGILSDGVGAGKTATALRLICDDAERSGCGDFRGGTLVIIPPHLLLHWQTEIEKFTTGLCALYAMDRLPSSCRTLADVMRADIVVTSCQFLRSARYFGSVISDVCEALSIDADVMGTLTGVRSCVTAARARGMTEEKLPPMLELVSWRRVVVDEVHEMLKFKAWVEKVALLRSSVYWGMTATPDISYDQARMLLSHSDPLDCVSLHTIERNLVRASTFEHGMEVRHVLHEVRLSALEHLLLRSIHGRPIEEVVQAAVSSAEDGDVWKAVKGVMDSFLVCKSQIEEKLVLAQRQVQVAAHTLEEETGRLQVYLQGADGNGSEVVARSAAIRQSIRTLRRHVDARDFDCQRLVARRDACQGRLDFLEQRTALVDMCDGACPACSASASECMLQCGHVFCIGCASWAEESGVCPVCRSEAGQCVRVGANTCTSTKVEVLAKFVAGKSAEGERVIVFCQFKKSMRAIKAAMSGCVLTLSGMLSSKSKSIEKFMETEGSVLLLAWDESCSGLSLQCCRHVVFAHPYCGDEVTMREREVQAIGRVVRIGCVGSVWIHHFVAADTEEERIWNFHTTLVDKKASL